MSKSKIGLVLSGGGARAAYQVGVIKAIYEISEGLGKPTPFNTFSGTSAGSINASHLASYAHSPKKGVSKLSRLWGDVTSDQVYHVDSISLFRSSLKLFFQLFSGSLTSVKKKRSFLETDPLFDLLSKEINFATIQKNIDKGFLDSLSITAMNYSAGNSCSFFQCNRASAWERHQRIGIPSRITVDHVMASTAIPLLFPPIKVDNQYYGDGNIRNNSPLSAPIRLGAEKLLVIGTRKKRKVLQTHGISEPSLARVSGVLLNSIFLDGVDSDYERLTRINDTVTHLKKGAKTALKPIDVLMIRPSQDLGKIAFVESMSLPPLIQFLVRGLGTQKEASDLISYLLFEPPFTQRLIALGYKDGMAQKKDISSFLK